VPALRALPVDRGAGLPIGRGGIDVLARNLNLEIELEPRR